MINVKEINDNTFDVTVKDGTTTSHRVHLTDDYYAKLTSQKVTREELIKKSFQFLLERESNTMILSQFDLPIIQNYFPNYETDIRFRLSK